MVHVQRSTLSDLTANRVPRSRYGAGREVGLRWALGDLATLLDGSSEGRAHDGFPVVFK